MKIIQKIIGCKERVWKALCLMSLYAVCANNACANEADDVIGSFLTTHLSGLFGSSSGFWKVFILADVAMATLASMKNKNPMVFVGVFMTALVPGFLINRYVFK